MVFPFLVVPDDRMLNRPSGIIFVLWFVLVVVNVDHTVIVVVVVDAVNPKYLARRQMCVDPDLYTAESILEVA